MQLFNIIAVLLTLSALFSYLNHRFVKLPTTIGVMVMSLIGSLLIIIIGNIGIGLKTEALALVSSIDFDETLLHGMLSYLLFAGALHIDINRLARQKYIIAVLATVGTISSTFIIGILSWYILDMLGLTIPLAHCLLFGALISPTDPIAVLGILRKLGVPESLETKICGESLFNDGIAVVLFLVLLQVATGSGDIGANDIILLFVMETGGGIIFGLVAGMIAYLLLKSVDNYQVEVLITLALVTGGYALADTLHLSGPIAIVVAGLLIGNHGRMLAMSEQTRNHLDLFWELVDEVLNVVLFVLIGLEVLLITWNQNYLIAGAIIIPILLITRFLVVALPIKIMRIFRTFSPGVIKILTWGGLRGGISVALALSMPEGPERDTILAITYMVVVFSITVQGLTIGKLIKSPQKSIPYGTEKK